jgi:hypothetical protein
MRKIKVGDGLVARMTRGMNERADGVTGIQMAVDAKKMRKREQKISMMVEADIRASSMERSLGLED